MILVTVEGAHETICQEIFHISATVECKLTNFCAAYNNLQAVSRRMWDHRLLEINLALKRPVIGHHPI